MPKVKKILNNKFVTLTFYFFNYIKCAFIFVFCLFYKTLLNLCVTKFDIEVLISGNLITLSFFGCSSGS